MDANVSLKRVQKEVVGVTAVFLGHSFFMFPQFFKPCSRHLDLGLLACARFVDPSCLGWAQTQMTLSVLFQVASLFPSES